MEGAVDNVIELSDDGPFTSLVARYTVVLPCLNHSLVVPGTFVDPRGWVVGEVVVVVRRLFVGSGLILTKFIRGCECRAGWRTRHLTVILLSTE